MANPQIVTITANSWVKVATNVTTGKVYNAKTTVSYSQTYRDTGEAAPSNMDDAVRAFIVNGVEEISASAGIDVYIYAHGDVDGSVRVDL